MNLAPLPWQQDHWATLSSARARGAFSHAWLLAGPAGVGKKQFAAALAASLLCQAVKADWMACGECAACRMLASGGHPDAHLLSFNGHLGLASCAELELPKGISFWTPDSGSKRSSIAVHAARSLIEKLTTVAHFGGNRVVVISPASELNVSAANALLKTIEEPPANTTLIFLAEMPQNLLPTIRSRCQLLRFPIPPRGQALSWLYGQHDQADGPLLDEAGGAPLRALHWLASGEVARRARWKTVLEAVAARRSDALAAAFELSREKEETGSLLRYWQATMAAQLRSQPGSWSPRHESFYALLLENLRRLEDTNANAQLVLESLLLRWRVLLP